MLLSDICGSIRYSTALKRDQTVYLRQVDTELKDLLVLITVSGEQKYITEKKAFRLQTHVSEPGRICGGLMKAV